MNDFSLFLCLFLLGAIPSGPIVCNLLRLKDPSSYGSRNVGATNVARQNQTAGIYTLLLDFSKALLPLSFLNLGEYWILAPILGHCFSPFLKFRGGKGVATALGGLFAAKLSLGLFASLLFITAYSASQNVGASSIMTCLLLMIYSIIFGEAYLLMSAGFVLIRHHDNYQQMRLKQLWNPLF
ncbi:glycerol-3-phosphate acyltransferase [Gammaproteobacteria bacterium]|nr:glycerol-3-phosphate acyltransferase [Gammaproteobacteria bacterium]